MKTPQEMLRAGGEWLGAARNWLQWNTRKGSHVTWGSADVVGEFTARMCDEFAAAVAAVCHPMAKSDAQEAARVLLREADYRWDLYEKHARYQDQEISDTCKKVAEILAPGLKLDVNEEAVVEVFRQTVELYDYLKGDDCQKTRSFLLGFATSNLRQRKGKFSEDEEARLQRMIDAWVQS